MNKLGMWFLISTAVFVLIILALYGAFRLGQGNRDSSSKSDNDKVVAIEATANVGKPMRIKTKPSQLVAGPETNIVYNETSKGEEVSNRTSAVFPADLNVMREQLQKKLDEERRNSQQVQ
jgi:hypothetical protein